MQLQISSHKFKFKVVRPSCSVNPWRITFLILILKLNAYNIQFSTQKLKLLIWPDIKHPDKTATELSASGSNDANWQ